MSEELLIFLGYSEDAKEQAQAAHEIEAHLQATLRRLNQITAPRTIYTTLKVWSWTCDAVSDTGENSFAAPAYLQHVGIAVFIFKERVGRSIWGVLRECREREGRIPIIALFPQNPPGPAQMASFEGAGAWLDLLRKKKELTENWASEGSGSLITTELYRDQEHLKQILLKRVEDFLFRKYSYSQQPMSETAEAPHRLRIFLCHSSGDKQTVRDLYKRLRADGFDPWLDEENLLPGQDWSQVIPESVSAADVVLVCLSRGAVNKKGYVQKEIKYALDVADEQPENTIYLIPLKLEECDIPQRLRRWHWVSLFEATGYERLLSALRHRAESINVTSTIGNLHSSSNSTPITGPVSAGEAVEDREANRKLELIASRDAPSTRIEPAAQARPEIIQREAGRQKRVKKFIWAGVIAAVLGAIFVIISITLTSTGGPQNQPPIAHSANAETYFNRGEECGEKRDYGCAIDNYSKATELNPWYAEAFYRRGAVYADTDRFDQAIEDFGRAIELNPQHAEAFYNRGVAYDNKGAYEEAVKDYSKAIELNSQFAAAYNNRGGIYAARGDYLRAIKDYDEAIKLNSQYAVAHYNRGGTYDDIGNYDQAIKDYNRAIELNPRYHEAYFNLGLIHHNKGRYRQAVEAYNKAIELNPWDADVYNARGITYQRLGQHEQAMADRQTYNELSAKR